MGTLTELGPPPPTRASLALIPGLRTEGMACGRLENWWRGLCTCNHLIAQGAKARPRHSKADPGFASSFAWDFLWVTDSQDWPLLSGFQEPSWMPVVWGRWLKPLRTSSLLKGTSWSVWAQISPPFGGNTEALVQLLPGQIPPFLRPLHSHTGFLTCKSSTGK